MRNAPMRAAVAALLAAGLTGVAHGQGGGSFTGAGSGGSRAASLSVVSALWSHDDPDHVPVLEFLVLFRGSPGWFFTTGPGTNGYNFSGSNGRSTSHTFATSAGVTVSIDSDPSQAARRLMVTSKLATIFDRQFDPQDLNVVLVDGVDGPGQPTVETRFIGPRLAGDGDALARAFRNSPELMNFLRCDAVPPEAPLGVPSAQWSMIRRIPMVCGQ